MPLASSKPPSARPASGAATRLSGAQLVASLENLPAAAPVALRVLSLVDDPSSDSRTLAAAVSADPALTAQVMRLANSAYYGLSGRVTSASFAITVLGFSTVRTLAAIAAAGLDDGRPLPPGFWEHASVTAAAAAIVAPRLGARRHDAFSLGLLHDIGAALLHRIDPDAVPAGVNRVRAEATAFGIDHAHAAAVVLESWRFPAELTGAIRRHHRPAEAATTSDRVLLAAAAIARLAMPTHDPVDDEEQAAALDAAGIPAEEADELVGPARRDAAALAASFRS